MNPDLLIMAFVTDIIPPAFIEAPTRGTICYHPSLLPRRRCGSAINGALILGDKEMDLSIFWTDAGIDTGPILLQKRLPIAREDTTGSLYLNRLFPLGVEAIAESVDLIKAGRAPRLVQDESLATYELLCNDQVARIDGERPAEESHNLSRGLTRSIRVRRSASSMPGAATPFWAPSREKSSKRMWADSL